MAEAFSVDLARLAHIVERMGHYQELVDGMLGEVDSAVKNLHSAWEGAASRAHADAHAEWRSGADLMRDALRQLQSAGSHAKKAYDGAVEANTTMWA
jgi:WXG100 family type VII secretion target